MCSFSLSFKTFPAWGSTNVLNDKLKLHISKFGSYPAPITAGLWHNQTRPLKFSLIVDNFRIKCERQADISYLLGELKTIYNIYEDWSCKLYCVIRLYWDYYKQEFLVSIPNYVTKSLHKFQHPSLRQSQYVSHQWTGSNYSATKQLTTPLDTSPPIPDKHKLRIQQIVGNFLYYTHAMDWTTMTVLTTISEQH